MPETLQSLGINTEVHWTAMLIRLGIAALFGLVVAGIYAGSQQRRNGGLLSMFTTLVLLTILVAMTTIVIGDNLARAFGLVGALSIVRFRTVVEDTRDTSFVIFAVVVGMAVGAGNFLVCLAGIPVVAMVAFALRGMGNRAAADIQRKLEVRIGTGHDPETLLANAFRDQLISWQLVSIMSARQGAALDVAYQVRLRDNNAAIMLVKSLNMLEGVQSVELKQLD